MAPNNNIGPWGPGPFNLIFANQFQWAPYNNIYCNFEDKFTKQTLETGLDWV